MYVAPDANALLGISTLRSDRAADCSTYESEFVSSNTKKLPGTSVTCGASDACWTYVIWVLIGFAENIKLLSPSIEAV